MMSYATGWSNLVTALVIGLLTLSSDTGANEMAKRSYDLGAGAGLGAQYGIVGASLEGRYNFRMLGLSIGLGGPLVPTISAGLWLPGTRIRLGVLGHLGAQPFPTSCGTDSAADASSRCHVVLVGGNLALDQDIGERNGFLLRYGLGLTLVGSGGAGFPLPGAVGLVWQW